MHLVQYFLDVLSFVSNRVYVLGASHQETVCANGIKRRFPQLSRFAYNRCKLLTYSSFGIAAAPPTSSAEAIHNRVFRPLARYTLRMGGQQ